MKVDNILARSATALLLCAVIFWPAVAQEGDDATAVVLDILKSGDEDMAAVAIGMVKEMHGEGITKAFAAELPNLGPTSQVQLISALGDRGDSAALPAIVDATESESESVRVAAVKAIGQLGGSSEVMLLADIAAESNGAEQKAARESLARLRGDGVDATILDAIEKAEPEAAVELIDSVGQRNIRAGVETLLDTAHSEDRKIRSESIKVLKVIAEPNDLPDLVQLLLDTKSSSARTEAEKTIAAVAHKIEKKDRQAQAVLAVLPNVKDMKKQASLMSVLGRIGDSTALPVLRKALESENADMRTAAIRALSQWPTSEPADDLFDVAASAESPLHKILALRGFVDLLKLPSERPAKETVAMYAEAMKLAPNVFEKRRVLSGLSSTGSPEALEMVKEYLSDQTLFREAEVAVVRIAEAMAEKHPDKARGALDMIIERTKSDATREQAQEVLDKMDGKAEDQEQ